MEFRLFESSTIDRTPDRVSWDSALPALLRSTLERWDLTAQEAFTGGESASVIAVTTASGVPAVLKLGFPHAEAVGEAVALAAWAPHLAPRVLRQDAWTWALLTDRVLPGTPLSAARLPSAESVALAGELHAQIRRTPAPDGVPAVSTIVRDWCAHAHDFLDYFDAVIPHSALGELADALALVHPLLAAEGGRNALVHGDFNPGNLLYDDHLEGWRVIDPKPMVGDPHFDAAPLVAQLGAPFASGDDPAALRGNLNQFCRAADLDPHRCALWGALRAGLDLVWAAEECDESQTAAAAARLRVWSRALDDV